MKTLPLILVLGALAAGPAFATCVYPQAPDHIPDGNTATLKEMLAGQTAVKAFDSSIKAYTDCLRLEHDQQLKGTDPSKMTADEKTAYAKKKTELDNVLIQKNDAAVDADTAVTKRFNEQVKVYKAKHKS